MNKETSNSSVLPRFYLLVGGLTLFAFVLIGKLIYIQFYIGEEGVNVGSGTIIKNVVLEPSRGNIYSADGNILATSIPRYELHWDAVVPSETVFKVNKKILADSLKLFMDGSSDEILKKIEEVRFSNNRYWLVAKILS